MELRARLADALNTSGAGLPGTPSLLKNSRMTSAMSDRIQLGIFDKGEQVLLNRNE